MELPLPPVAIPGTASLAKPEEAWRARRNAQRAWMAVPKPVRAAMVVLLLVGALGMVFPRIQSSVRRVHLETPALWVRLGRSIDSHLRARAAIEIEDDFASGLSGWDGGPGGLKDWVYDQAGLVQPGKLGLLNASRTLLNYRFEIVGAIRKKGLSWVFRAADRNNYYAMKIVITQPGPVPRMALVRYTVVRGVASGRVQFPLPLNARNDSLYRIETKVYRDSFVTSVNGGVVDAFFDGRHPSGGVGLFSGPGEEPRIVRIRIADRDDLLGRLCAHFLRYSADSW